MHTQFIINPPFLPLGRRSWPLSPYGQLRSAIRSCALELLGLERRAVNNYSIGIASWAARADTRAPAQLGVLAGVLTYNALGAAVLVFAGTVLSMAGVALWPAVASGSRSRLRWSRARRRARRPPAPSSPDPSRRPDGTSDGRSWGCVSWPPPPCIT